MIVAKWLGSSLAAVLEMPVEYYETAIEMIREEYEAIKEVKP